MCSLLIRMGLAEVQRVRLGWFQSSDKVCPPPLPSKPPLTH
jgi:hypothetical protein